MEIEEQKVYQEMVDALNSHDKVRIAKAKYDFLFFGKNLFDIVINYTNLINNGVDFDFSHRTIKKGTKLFRIRRFESGVDFSNESQWKNPPSKPENRTNSNGESALYLGTTENICLLETHIQNCEKYVLGEYEVVNDFVVGGFLSCEDFHNKYAYLTGMILNAFLIAPSRSDKNARLFIFLDDLFLVLEIKGSPFFFYLSKILMYSD